MNSKTLMATLIAALLVACGKSGDDSNKPTISDLQKSSAVTNAANSTMAKGDPSKPLTEYREINSGNQLMFLYYGLLSLPVDYEKISSVYSQEYKSTNDTFKKSDIVKALQGRIDNEINSAKNNRYIIWTIVKDYSSALNPYDMSSKSFKVKDLGSDGYYYWNDNASSYLLQFTNAGEFSNLKITDEAKAREIEAMISKNKPMTVKLYAFVQDADPSRTAVKAEIMKIVVTGANGESIYPQ